MPSRFRVIEYGTKDVFFIPETNTVLVFSLWEF